MEKGKGGRSSKRRAKGGMESLYDKGINPKKRRGKREGVGKKKINRAKKRRKGIQPASDLFSPLGVRARRNKSNGEGSMQKGKTRRKPKIKASKGEKNWAKRRKTLVS